MTENDTFLQLCHEIDALPSRQSAKRAAFDAALASIEAALERGNTVDDISKIFSRHKIEIAPSTLRQYLREARKANEERQPSGSAAGSTGRKRAKAKESASVSSRRKREGSPSANDETTGGNAAESIAMPRQPVSQTGKIYGDF
jgi:hypothetical protein